MSDDKDVLMGLVKDNIATMTRNTETLNRIHEDFNKAIVQYGEFGKTLTKIEVLMGVLVGLMAAMLLSALGYMFFM